MGVDDPGSPFLEVNARDRDCPARRALKRLLCSRPRQTAHGQRGQGRHQEADSVKPSFHRLFLSTEGAICWLNHRIVLICKPASAASPRAAKRGQSIRRSIETSNARWWILPLYGRSVSPVGSNDEEKRVITTNLTVDVPRGETLGGVGPRSGSIADPVLWSVR